MNLKIKEAVAKIIGVFTGAEDIIMASGEPGIRAKRSDTGVKVAFIVGAGGTNHGIYSYKLNRWMVYSDGTYTWFDAGGGHYRWDMGTNNTTDTWVPVLSNGKLQHRVIPRDIMTTRQKTVTILRQYGASNSISADAVSGYTFVCWLQPATVGWIGGIYIENPTSASTKIWMCTPTQVQQAGNVVVTALYKANF